MASLLSPRRTGSDLSLRATVAQTEREGTKADVAELPRVGWLLVTVAGALAASLVGWIVVCGLVVLGWLTAAPGSLTGAMHVGTQLWLLANGAGARLGTTSLTLVPFAATLMFAVLLSRSAAFSARQALKFWSPPGSPGPVVVTWRRWAALGGLSLASYAVSVAAVVVLISGGSHGVRGASLPGLAGVLVVLGLAAARGSSRGLGYRPSARWPWLCRVLPRAALGAQAALGVAGTAALVVGLVGHVNRVGFLSASLHAGPYGTVLLWLVQLAYLPTAIVWAASYTLGAGFTLGAGSVVAPAATSLGLLPSVPMLGALPRSVSGDVSQLWWLAAGVVAGCVAAALATARRPAKLDEVTLVGGLAGLLGGLVFAGVAWTASGDLGDLRLAGLGPRMLPLLVMSASTLGLSGLLFGLVSGLLRIVRGRHVLKQSRAAGRADSAGADESEETVSIEAG